MADINALLNLRTKKSEQTSKMADMAKRSASGNLTSFAGVFSVAELSQKERDLIGELVKNFAQESNINLERDLETLLSLTSEVKAIHNQSILLHGERIKKAHDILIQYREGAFTAWLIAAYGNRQTPYNLMQYYEFYEAMPKTLRPQLESMPRQAVYTLASRTGSREKKQEIVQNYKGETKLQLLELIRYTFPLGEQDKRTKKINESFMQSLRKLAEQLKTMKSLNSKRKKEIKDLLYEMLEDVVT